MKQILRIFRKKLDDDKYRYWASVSTESKKDSGDYCTANIPVNLSGTAKEIFDSCSEKSKTKGIRYARIEVTDAWLKAARFGKDDVVVLFINKCIPAEQSDSEDDE